MTEQEVSLLITKAVLDSDTKTRLLNPEKRAALLTLFDLDVNEVDLLMGIDVLNLEEFAQACIENGLVKDPINLNPRAIPTTVPKPSPRQK
jgi:hypothetical protein